MPKPKKPKLKIHPFARKRALVLLSRGMSIEECVSELSKRHPGYSLEDVERAYFPKHGGFVISNLEKASREEILKTMEKMNRIRRSASLNMRELRKRPGFVRKLSEISSERIRRLNADPEFARKRNEAASRTMRRLNADPEFARKRDEAASRTMRRLNADPEFWAKRSEGLRRYREEYRLNHYSKLLENLERGIGTGVESDSAGRLRDIAVDLRTPEKLVLDRESQNAIESALANLTEFQRKIISLHFGFEDNLSLDEIAAQLGSTPNRVKASLSLALQKLSKNKELIDLFG